MTLRRASLSRRTLEAAVKRGKSKRAWASIEVGEKGFCGVEQTAAGPLSG